MLYNLILLLPAFTALFWAFLILFNNWKKIKVQMLFICALLFIGIGLLSFVLPFFAGSTQTERYLIYILLSLTNLLILPFFHLYFRLITNQKPLKWWFFLIFTPSIFNILMVIIVFISADFVSQINYIDYYYFSKPGYDFLHPQHIIPFKNYFSIVLLLFIITQTIYSIVSIYKGLKVYKNNILNFYSNVDEKGIEQNYTYYYAMIGLLVTISITYIVPFNLFYSNYYLLFIVLGAVTILLFLLANSVYRNKFSIENFIIDAEIAEVELSFAEEESLLKKNYPPDLIDKINKVIDEEQLFLDANLNLQQLSQRIATNRSYLSRSVNDTYNQTFSEYINGKRIEYAKQLMNAQPILFHEEIALKSGFKQVSSFNRSFRQIVGTTPSQWKKG